jgi:hypothetical protein
MDKQTAKQNLKELRDSLSRVLEGKEYQSADEIKEQSKEAIQQARSAGKQLKKSLLEKVKDLPVVQKVSELGTAGSVAVSTAAVAQTTVAVDQTEVFVASVANDVVENRIEVPMFIDSFVDFHELNDWGQVVIAEKIAAVSELPQISQPSADAPDTTQETSPSSQNSSGETPSQTSQPEQTDKSQESQNKGQGSKGENSSNDKQGDKEQKQSEQDKSSKDNGSKQDNKGKQESGQEQKTEGKQESQESKSSSDSEPKSDNVKSSIPKVETPYIPMNDDIKPHPRDSILQVSPVN